MDNFIFKCESRAWRAQRIVQSLCLQNILYIIHIILLSFTSLSAFVWIKTINVSSYNIFRWFLFILVFLSRVLYERLRIRKQTLPCKIFISTTVVRMTCKIISMSKAIRFFFKSIYNALLLYTDYNEIHVQFQILY